MSGREPATGHTAVRLQVNGEQQQLDVDPDVPLLTVLRNDLGLVGAKRGCAQEQCYACCVLIDGRTQPSCRIPVGQVGQLPVTTVEADWLDPLREYFLVEQAGQCGFCIAGMIVAAQGLLNQVRRPNDGQIREALDTNLCRCGIYDRVRRAVRFRIGEPDQPIWQVRAQPPLAGRTNDRPVEPSPSLTAHPDLDSWIVFGEPDVDDGETITVFTGKAELGQGITTALAAIAADELSVDPARIRVVGPDTERSPDEGVTSGSLSVETSGAAVRSAAATARAILLDRAARVLGSTSDELLIDNGIITGTDGSGRTSYWELSGRRSFNTAVRLDSPTLDPPPADQTGDDELDRAGTRARVDLPAKVAGSPAYVQDLRPEGMAHGRIVRPPAHHVRLQSADVATVEAMPGVLAVVRDGSFLGVVAEREEQAEVAAMALADLALWSDPPTLPDPHTELRTGSSADYYVVDGVPVDHDIPSPMTEGETPGSPVGEASMLSATYTKPFILHGSLGPSAALAHFEVDRLTVWSHSQGVFALRDALCEVLAMPQDRVRVVHREGAGCYGHNGADDVALDASLLARAVPGRPVLTSWTRADEHRWEPYGPAMIVELRAELTGDRITAFDSENWSYGHTTRPRARGDGSTNLLAGWLLAQPFDRPTPAPIRARHVGAHRNSDPIYAIEERRVQTHLVGATTYRTSALRALGAYANVFALESFVDELAADRSFDPLRFRLQNLVDDRAKAVIEAVADAADWSRSRPPGQGRGLAFARYKNAQTYLAVVIDVSVDDESGLISVDQATIAADAGRIVSNDGLSNQLEGGCVQAASWTLKEAVDVAPDGVRSEDWETYPILRFSDSFPVNTVLLDRPDQPSLGCGEAAQGPTAAAIANAVHDAVGIRLRDLPLTPDRVLAALAGRGRQTSDQPSDDGRNE